MSQMPNATPQGLAGLMQQRPQAPQMPTPGKASPMAGLGSVDDRVAAYMGDTKPLEKRYAMSQDLLDLLALQKIKSQKDAAARQMQLQMAQQNAQDGQSSMTVAQQREQEVGEMTKNELAEQRGDTAQKQAGDQQAAMQKLMGGIAAAPGAAAAAQPKAMAAGGIVGYAGPEGSVVGAPEEKNPEMDEEGNPRPKSERDRIMAENARMREMKANAQNLSRMRESRMAGLQGANAGVPERMAEFYKPRRPEVTRADQAVTTQGAAPADKLPPANVVAAATQGAPKPPAPPAPAAPKPPGIAGLPGAAGAAPAGAGPVPTVPANDFGSKLEAAALKNAEIDPAARQLSEEQRIEGRMALTPEQRKVYEEGIGGLQKMYNEQYDPERLQREGLKRALIGAGGRRYGEFAGAAEAGMGYDEKMRAAKLKEFGDVQNARTGLIGIDRANVKEAIAGGQKAYEQGSLSQRQGLESGSRLYGTDVESRNKALDREIEKLKIAAQRDATAASRESLSYDKARTIYANTLNKVEQLERNLDKDFAAGPLGMLLMQDPSKLKPEDKNRLEIAKLELEKQKAKIRKEMEPVLESARSKLGVSSSDGFGEMKKVDSKK
jgi:hypothetical protein